MAFVFLILSIIFSCSKKPVETETKDLQKLAIELVEFVDAGDYENASAMFDSAMTEVFHEEMMNQSWQVIEAKFGEIGELVESRTESVDGYDIVFLIYNFSNSKVEVKVVFDSEQKVAGFFAYPLEVSAIKPLPAYIDTSAFTEKLIEIGEGEWVLPGTYTIPKNTEKFPVVILVHGSGPNDRDETMGPNKPFRDIAWGLASAGIGVLRYDKRTYIYPEKVIEMYDELTLEDETIDDALSAVGYLLKNTWIDSSSIFIAGHSLGAMAIPAIASRVPNLGGFIIMAGNTRKLEELTLEQVNYIFGLDSFTKEESLYIDTLKAKIANIKMVSEDTVISPEDLPFGVSQVYWAYLENYDQLAEAGKIKKPVLVIQGERDYQVTMVDFAGWKSKLSHLGNFSFKSYPYLNHLFMEGEGRSTPEEYMIPNYVSGDVISDIIDWIKTIEQK